MDFQKHHLKIQYINNIQNRKLKIVNKFNLKLKVRIFILIITRSKKLIHHIRQVFIKKNKKFKKINKKFILNQN